MCFWKVCVLRDPTLKHKDSGHWGVLCPRVKTDACRKVLNLRQKILPAKTSHLHIFVFTVSGTVACKLRCWPRRTSCANFCIWNLDPARSMDRAASESYIFINYNYNTQLWLDAFKILTKRMTPYIENDAPICRMVPMIALNLEKKRNKQPLKKIQHWPMGGWGRGNEGVRRGGGGDLD